MKVILKNDGFTIVELLIVMAMSGILMGAVYSTFYSQQKSYVLQEQISAMQQNSRAGMFYLEMEIRVAGCDPTGNANARIITADPELITFTSDIRGAAAGSPPDGDTDDPNENITYSLGDIDGDGIGDHLDRNNEIVAEDIDALNFVYLDELGNVTATLSDIRSVQIALVAKTRRRDIGYINNRTYKNLGGTVIYTSPGDNFRRKLLTAEIKGRNLGL